ncbi:hypothetical protein [Parafrankia sp. EUN1f]|uniref:hypothetical protein n=1 Tax=Parafrankia sp. EUN1f TaxID=102897 RepID=UPI0001C43966|nr:hypothetical protein [Parafrankia sp. EUN1f]EFC85909.1 hypothetical protein FrEUN1fDRAFT_0886 [Parafrankia sp. EUN1f]
MMTHRGFRLMAAAVPLAVLVVSTAACTETSGDGRGDRPRSRLTYAPGTTRTPPAPRGSLPGDSADSVAIRVDVLGGMVTVDMQAVRLPSVVVYQDGRVITRDPSPAGGPGPALPALQLRRISAADVQKLVDLAVAAGVGGDRDFGQPRITDSSTTRFTVRTADGVRTTSVYALSEYTPAMGGSELTARQRSAREALEQLQDALTDLPTTLGPRAVSEPEPYTPAAVAAFVEPRPEGCPSAPSGGGPLAGCDPATGTGVPAWPGPSLPGEPFGSLTRTTCATVSGDQARELLAVARTAVSTTRWTSDGRQWMVRFRPLLPDETGCADLLP